MLTLTDKELFIIGDFIKKYLDEKYPCTTDDNCDTKPEDIDIEKVHNKICYYVHTNPKIFNCPRCNSFLFNTDGTCAYCGELPILKIHKKHY